MPWRGGRVDSAGAAGGGPVGNELAAAGAAASGVAASS